MIHAKVLMVGCFTRVLGKQDTVGAISTGSRIKLPQIQILILSIPHCVALEKLFH